MNALMQLNDRHERFALEYVRTRNASTAYRLAYPDAELSTCGSRSSELLKDPLIVKLVKSYQDILKETYGLDAQRVIEEMKAAAFSNITDVLEIDAHTIRLKSSSEISEEARSAISEISMGAKGEIKVKMHSKLEALAKLGTHLGLFDEKVNVTVKHEHDLSEVAKATLERIRANRVQAQADAVIVDAGPS